MQPELKAYLVDLTNVIAHYSPAEALDYFCESCGFPRSDFVLDDVEDATDELLDEPKVYPDGSPAGTLREVLEAATGPEYMYKGGSDRYGTLS